MKILLIFIFYLLSGPADSSEVIGYSGGSVFLLSDMEWYSSDSKFICKVNEKGCTDIIRVDTKQQQAQHGRFKLYANTENIFLVWIRKLKPQDAGTYRFGLGNKSNSTVNLKVYNNASCGVPKIMNANPGQNITITCNYPEEYKRNYKYVTSVDYDDSIAGILNTNTRFQNERFSISDDRSAKVLSVNISDVRETDEVFYLFGVLYEEGELRYFSHFGEILLHVTDKTANVSMFLASLGLSTNIQPTTSSYMVTSAALKGTPSAVCFSSSVIIGCVCICVALLLIGGFSLMMIYKLRHKRTRDYKPTVRSNENKPCTSDNYTDPDAMYENMRMSST